MEPKATRERLLETTVTHLEMVRRPDRRRFELPRGFAIQREPEIDIGEYRNVYRRIGDPWLWFERKRLDDDQLRAIVHDPRVDIRVLYGEHGASAGLAEIDLRSPPDAELAYFGLVPELIGRGVGRAFFDAVVEAAWDAGIARFWLHTCTLDHPQALEFYRRAGLEPFKTEQQIVVDPRTQSWWDR